jgi:phosphatidylglycerophosphate synthase
MFDAALRPIIDPPLNAVGARVARRGVSADHVTIVGCAIGLAAAVAIALGSPLLGLALIIANRIADGLDGAIARATVPTPRGGFLDIVLDFVFYAVIPLAFAIVDPAQNALPAAALLASFLVNGAAFFTFAITAEKRGLITETQGKKSLYYVSGLAEGSETIAVFCAFCLWPGAFPWIAYAFTALCTVSAAGRLVLGWRTFGAAA